MQWKSSHRAFIYCTHGRCQERAFALTHRRICEKSKNSPVSIAISRYPPLKRWVRQDMSLLKDLYGIYGRPITRERCETEQLYFSLERIAFRTHDNLMMCRMDKIRWNVSLSCVVTTCVCRTCVLLWNVFVIHVGIPNNCYDRNLRSVK